MASHTYKVYSENIKKIIDNPNTLAVFLVGSSKDVDFSFYNVEVNDIDVFVFVKEGEKQERVLFEQKGIEFDINYFSKDGVKKLLSDREYFFVKEMKDAKVLFDMENISNTIKDMSRDIYLKGPSKLSLEEKSFLKQDIETKISKLKNKEKFDVFEYHFLTNLYLKDIIIGYFNINDKWVPKDKKLLKVLKKENKELFNLVSKVSESYDYQKLLDVYNYIFKEIETKKIIKLIF
ncbi:MULTISPECIES: hypothetical protein [unclassified Clostridioides]|uniref:hypothetical protein n=1 Tax=unclassified Clostridioides TaxID=2635829 RepID=UPI001D0C1E7E|nr:hypothetical protein [Clostridioides sp. ES-S-0001-02]MCC0640277.1 hypothetical protein [Clostridioides sp. ES-S-0049-03]MCC0651942.1 hypothetical protein [Clostridioides sp. ES-S-0001-03]MCC0657746.1 hypothetical protein [Clostridioides sp. ES-S-0123-01]MCC0671216.1 hypothetical protein [Clostridioides sp. ES-S-0145-01]MCC0677054.1 hypothetical protein [Clostridioides sp. ES-W-0018-02]MCC0679022.1 hypothetical protein [Clostridioides sp. ES-S-0005-03]MCC0694322.1 hypothetical protein [Cl